MNDFRSADPQEAWLACGGRYQCPKTADGRRLGPLVGYAGTYEHTDGTRLHFVGEEYWNFAAVEEQSRALRLFADKLDRRLPWVDMGIQVVLAAPEGGKALAVVFSQLTGCRYAAAEKKVVRAATDFSPEEATLINERHEVRAGEGVLLVEDVCHNFSTTGRLCRLVEEKGAHVVGVVCALNRSLSAKTVPGTDLPVWSVIRRPVPEYRQDNPFVAADVASGNVVWKPKHERQRLNGAMRGVKEG